MVCQIIMMGYDNLYNMIGEDIDLEKVSDEDALRLQVQLREYIQRLHILIKQEGLQDELQGG